MKKSIAVLLTIMLTATIVSSVCAEISVNYTFKGVYDDNVEYIFNFGNFEGDNITQVGVQVNGKNYFLKGKGFEDALLSGKFGIGLADPRNILGETYSSVPYIISNDITEYGSAIEIDKDTVSDVSDLLLGNTLASVSINGDDYPDFRPDTTEYTVILPYGTVQLPEVAYELTDSSAEADIEEATSLPGTTVIVVTDSKGDSKTYTFNFVVLQKATALIKKASRMTRAANTPILIGNTATTNSNVRSYDTQLLNTSTSFVLFRFELDNELPAESVVISSEFNVVLKKTADKPTAVFNFHNASADWDLFPATDFPIDLDTIVGSFAAGEDYVPDYKSATVQLDTDLLQISGGKTIDIGASLVYAERDLYGYISFGSSRPYPEINIYYITD